MEYGVRVEVDYRCYRDREQGGEKLAEGRRQGHRDARIRSV